MTGSPELLEFYLVEATEYVDALDQLVASAHVAPDGNAFIAAARALRGSSTIAKADRIAELSLVIEQIAYGLRDGELPWSAELLRGLRSTVDDLRFLVRGVRTWGEREEARTSERLADLRRFVPREQPRAPAPAVGSATPVFVALQASAIAAELTAFVANPGHRRALEDALNRARTLRGIAGISELPPLADVADAIDQAGRGLMPDAPLSDTDAELFRSAADVLRRVSDELRAGSPRQSDSPEVTRFVRAVGAFRAGTPPSSRVVRIEELFFQDAGPHLVTRGSSPSMPAEKRFRNDAIARGEHLRRLVGDARQARDPASRDRAARDLRSALLDLENVAASFGVHQVAAFFGQAGRENDILNPTLLEAVDLGAGLLLPSSLSLQDLEQRLALLERARRTTPIAVPVIAPPIPGAPPAVTRRSPGAVPAVPAVPSVSELHVRSDTSPLSTTAPTAKPVSIPVETRTAVPVAAPAPTPTAQPRQDDNASLQAGAAAAAPPLAATPAPTGAKSPAALPASLSAPARPAIAEQSSAAKTPQHPRAVPPPRFVAPRKPPATPVGRELQDLLSTGIAGFKSLDDAPLSQPARLEDDEVVPIESLLYRGHSALLRAIELRNEMQIRGVTDDEALSEMFDLLDLARAE